MFQLPGPKPLSSPAPLGLGLPWSPGATTETALEAPLKGGIMVWREHGIAATE